MMGAFLDKPKTEKSSHSEAGVTLRYGLSAMQGWRIDMEDAHTSILSLPPPFESWAYFGVYDGHAGGIVSEVCSKKLLPSIMDTHEFKSLELNEAGDPLDIDKVKSGIRTGFLNLDKSIGISPEVESGEDKSGSTAVAVFITPKYVIFANCGDSRGMLTRSNGVHFSTEDHKPMNPGERDRIQKAGGTVMIQRINGSLAVSRSLGDFDYKKVESKGATEQLVSPEPEVTVIERRAEEDQVVILACDGIWDVMTNEELCDFVLNRCQRVDNLSKIAEEVIDNCLFKGSRDNMSLIIVATKNAPKLDRELANKDQRLNETIREKVHEYVERESSDLDINGLLMMIQGSSLSDLPPGGLNAKRYLIDSLFEDLCRDKHKKQNNNNSSEANHALSVHPILLGPGNENFLLPKRAGGAETKEAVEVDSKVDNNNSKSTK